MQVQTDGSRWQQVQTPAQQAGNVARSCTEIQRGEAAELTTQGLSTPPSFAAPPDRAESLQAHTAAAPASHPFMVPAKCSHPVIPKPQLHQAQEPQVQHAASQGHSWPLLAACSTVPPRGRHWYTQQAAAKAVSQHGAQPVLQQQLQQEYGSPHQELFVYTPDDVPLRHRLRQQRLSRPLHDVQYQQLAPTGQSPHCNADAGVASELHNAQSNAGFRRHAASFGPPTSPKAGGAAKGSRTLTAPSQLQLCPTSKSLLDVPLAERISMRARAKQYSDSTCRPLTGTPLSTLPPTTRDNLPTSRRPQSSAIPYEEGKSLYRTPYSKIAGTVVHGAKHSTSPCALASKMVPADVGRTHDLHIATPTFPTQRTSPAPDEIHDPSCSLEQTGLPLAEPQQHAAAGCGIRLENLLDPASRHARKVLLHKKLSLGVLLALDLPLRTYQ